MAETAGRGGSAGGLAPSPSSVSRQRSHVAGWYARSHACTAAESAREPAIDVTVIVRARDEAVDRRCLELVAGQQTDGAEVETIVVDNGSTRSDGGARRRRRGPRGLDPAPRFSFGRIAEPRRRQRARRDFSSPCPPTPSCPIPAGWRRPGGGVRRSLAWHARRAIGGVPDADGRCASRSTRTSPARGATRTGATRTRPGRSGPSCGAGARFARISPDARIRSGRATG